MKFVIIFYNKRNQILERCYRQGYFIKVKALADVYLRNYSEAVRYELKAHIQ